MNKSKWIWLASKCGIASKELPRLIEKLGEIEKIYSADYDQYLETGVSERLCEDLCDKSLTYATQILNYCHSARVGILCYDDERYPMSLRALADPPAVLYYKGNLPDLNKRLCISMVGTRYMSEYGMRAAYKISYEVASSGAVVISGMALGIDGISSAAAIAAGGSTVAVYGCGIDKVYPPEHLNLSKIIQKNGAIMTEFAPGMPPKKGNFPIRNRIISGLSQGAVIVDADNRSGALITANTARLQGKDIYAVPGNIDSETASGTNALIRDGAQAVLCGYDVISNYAYLYKDSIDIQRLRMAENHSDINLSLIKQMQIAVKAGGRRENNEKRTPAELGVAESKRVSKRRAGGDEKPMKKTADSPKPQKSDFAEKTEIHGAGNVTPKTSVGDNSMKIVESLSEKQRRIFDELPLDKAVTVDYFTALGFPMGEVMSTLTILEIKGLISSLPGALYVRK